LKVRLYIGLLFALLTVSVGGKSTPYLSADIRLARDTSVVEPSDSAVKHYLIRQGVKVTYNNTVKILPNGREKFADLFDVIRKAKSYVHLEYFNFRNDSIAGALFDLLAQKVSEGVEVRALFDDFGNWSNNKPLRNSNLRYIRHNGIQIYKFDPIKFPYVNHVFHRDHRKVVVVDGKVGYTGGMNVADYYINGLPKIGPWHDMHLHIEGGAVNELQHIFDAMWEKVTHQRLVDSKYYPPHGTADSGRVQVAIVDRTPVKSPDLLRHTFVQTIDAAEHHLRIINPYFVPTTSVRRALRRALKRGVNVEIMMSAKADIPFTPEASLHILHGLMKKGAKIYLYQGGFHHTKVMTVDERFCTVGTANLNSRSLRYDYEDNAYIFDRGITGQLDRLFENDEQHCVPLDAAYWKKLSAWKKFVCSFASLFTPVL
jgi:cardiolipin synthase